jgi:two-component system chemotaxis response regulator CheB
LVVIGASAGGVEALLKLTSHLPETLQAAVLIVVHVSSQVPSYLPQVLGRQCKLPVTHARNGEPIESGHVYVAPPDHHLIVQNGKMRLSHGPRQNGHRPAIDLLFESAARSHRQRVIGIVMSGMLDDGSRGLHTIKRCGGVAVVQAPEDALFPSMPSNALARVSADHTLPAAMIGRQLQHWVAEVNARQEDDPPMEMDERDFVYEDKHRFEEGEMQDTRTMLTCPDCGGVLWEMGDGDNLHYRCHVGHVYSIESLENYKDDILERALWAAVRTLEENASLARRMATHAREARRLISMEHFEARARQHAENANLIRRLLERNQSDTKALSNGAGHETENGVEPQPLDPDAPGSGA